ncbi:MFS transporter [Brevibacterium linens]|uniref:Predicted arabinose efflux permease, MFS family n=1 Tax=Brevibacterium linens TaxID=1703 RepID=A0A2H1I687_BRELN|nr:MFS transporter [Brevibacterium linens]SMX70683.1 Predicted arabinose efflux permease, MFS family [Brevibacterium linens]
MSTTSTSAPPTSDDPRVPLGPRNGSAVFLVSLAGLMLANLAPLIMSVFEQIGFDVVASGNILTWGLFTSAIIGLATSRAAAGTRRRTIAASGLGIAVIAFLIAALVTGPTALIVISFLLGSAGLGTAVSTSGAAIAALRNPNRVSASSGVVNRLLVMIVLAVIPVLGLAQITVFGSLALLSLISLAVTIWLPNTPEASTAEVLAETTAESVPASRRPRTPRTVLLAGIGVLIVFPVWGTSEDSVWTLAPTLGDAVGMTEQLLGFALSAAAGIGAGAMLVVTLLGSRIGRAVPLGIALALGGAIKIWISLETDPTTLAVLIIAVNTIYAFAFTLFIATAAGLDARGNWSGPLVGAYIVGSSFAPIIGAWIIDGVGIPRFGLIMGIVSFVLIIPTMLIARVSTRVEKTLNTLDETTDTHERTP